MRTRLVELKVDGTRLRRLVERSRGALALGLSFVAVLAQSCGGGGLPTASPTPTPSPSPALSTDVVPGRHTGPTEITFLTAEPPPGSTITGCGSASGCSGRVRMRFRLFSRSGGHVLDASATLHGPGLAACYRGSVKRFDLPRGVATDVVIVFDQHDAHACTLPPTIHDMQMVLSAPVEVASLQEWAVQYAFLP